MAGFGLSTGRPIFVRPDAIPGVPYYIDDPTVPGGWRINQAACAAPPAGRQGTLGRNALRGFPVSQTDLGVGRQFGLTERVKLEVKAEAFNVFNHPNFGAHINVLSNPLFGISQQSFGRDLSSGGTGVNPLYQIGGARSMQLAAKLRF
jgi:hypothetical protein